MQPEAELRKKRQEMLVKKVVPKKEKAGETAAIMKEDKIKNPLLFRRGKCFRGIILFDIVTGGCLFR